MSFLPIVTDNVAIDLSQEKLKESLVTKQKASEDVISWVLNQNDKENEKRYKRLIPKPLFLQ